MKIPKINWNSLSILFFVLVLAGLFYKIYYFTIYEYPNLVIERMMELQPGYLLKLPHDELGRGTFGDMYGGLNTLFSGIGIIGLLVTIIIQIYLYYHDKNSNKREKKDEERQLLYYLWFRLDSLLTPVFITIADCNSVIQKYSKMIDIEFVYVYYPYENNEDFILAMKHFDELNTERNHLIYLKYFNDNSFINIFSSILSLNNRTKAVVEGVNTLKQDVNTLSDIAYCKKMIDIITTLKVNLGVHLLGGYENRLYPQCYRQIISTIGPYTMSLNNETIEFHQLQNLSKAILALLDSIDGNTISFCENFYSMSEYFGYTRLQFYENQAKRLSDELILPMLSQLKYKSLLDKIKSKSKVPEIV